jgi:hypothetical protein
MAAPRPRGNARGWLTRVVIASGRAWDELMRRLGYKHYVSQGGDWSAIVSEAMARQALPRLLGIHVNMPAVVPWESGGRRAQPGRRLSSHRAAAWKAFIMKPNQFLLAAILAGAIGAAIRKGKWG